MPDGGFLEGSGKKIAQPNAGTGDAGLTDNQMFENRTPGLSRTTEKVDTGLSGQKEFFTYSVNPSTDPNYESNKANLRGLASAANNRPNQTMSNSYAVTANGQNQGQMRARQAALLSALEAASAGNGPSAAQQQLKMGADRNMANALAMAAAGGNSPAAMRAASFQRAAATQDQAGQAAMLRAQEMNDARGLLSNTLSGVRGQDMGLMQMQQQNNQFNAGLQQDASKTNLLAAVEQQKMRDDLVARYTAAGLSLDQAKFQAEQELQKFNADILAKQQAAQIGVTLQGSGQSAQLLGAGIGAAGTTLAAGLGTYGQMNAPVKP